MKKRRFLSVVTSIAMVATMAANAIATTVSAADVIEKTSTMALTLKPEKSSFTMDEVKAGNAKTTISLMCDNYDDAEQVTLLLTSFVGSASGMTFTNMTITEDNALTVADGFGEATMDFGQTGIDPADTSKPQSQTGFFIQNDGLSPFVKKDLSKSIVTFDVSFDPSMAAGKYTVDFDSSFAVTSGVGGTTLVQYGKSVRSNSTIATITLGDSVDPTAAPTTVAPTAAPTTQPTEDNKEYEGDADIWADKVEAEPGETVTVNMYADTHDKKIRGFEARAIYDKSMLELTSMKMGKGFVAKATINAKEGVYIVSSASTPITNDPSTPFAVLTFKVSDAAKAGDVYDIDIQGSNGAAKPIVNVKNGGEGTTYLKPIVDAGSITIKGATTGATTAAPTQAPTTSTSGNKTYEGTAKIWADKVEAEPGETVTVNMYADTDGFTIRGFEARAIYDKSMLELTSMKMGKGFAAKATINVKEGVYIVSSASTPITNDPSTPFAVLTFKVSDAAKAGDVYDIDIQGSNGAAKPIVNVKNGGEGTTYLEPIVNPGSITIKGATTGATTAATTAATTPTPTTVATTVASTAAPTTAGSTQAPQTNVSIIEITSIKVVEVTSIVPVTSIEKVTSIENVTNIVPVTSIVPVPGTIIDVITSIEKVTSIEKITSVEKVTSIENVTNIVPVTSIVPVPGTIIDVITSIEKVTSIEKITSVEKVTSIENVTNIVPVTSYVILTSIVPVPGTLTTTAVPTTGDISIVTDYDIDDFQDQWYHSDNVEFFTDGIVVKNAAGEDVTADATISFATTPGEVYNGKDFDYEVEYTVEIDGQEFTGTIPVKIGPRGDANYSAGKSADIYDAIIIAKFILPKPAANIPKDTFQYFLGDNNEDGVVNIYDAINVAKLILPANGGNWDKVSKDHQNWIKD